MRTFKVSVILKKLKELDGYVGNAYTPGSFVAHLQYKFKISGYDMNRYLRKNQIIIYLEA